MPKKKKAGGKKGGKKKGGKKKTGGKKSSSKAPKLNDGEKFLQFTIATRTESMNAWRRRRDELLSDNETKTLLRQQLLDERNGVVREIKKEQNGLETEKRSTSMALDRRLQEAIAKKHAMIREEDKAVAELQDRLASLRQEIEHRGDVLRGLEQHRERGAKRLAMQIELLQERRRETEEDNDTAKETLRRRFRLAQRSFEKKLDVRLERKKEEATTQALRGHSMEEKLAFRDNGWLHREVDEHSRETERLVAACEALEEENLLLLQRLCGDTGDPERWVSVEDYQRLATRQRFGSGAVEDGEFDGEWSEEDEDEDEDEDEEGEGEGEGEDDDEEDDDEEDEEDEEDERQAKGPATKSHRSPAKAAAASSAASSPAMSPLKKSAAASPRRTMSREEMLKSMKGSLPGGLGPLKTTTRETLMQTTGKSVSSPALLSSNGTAAGTASAGQGKLKLFPKLAASGRAPEVRPPVKARAQPALDKLNERRSTSFMDESQGQASASSTMRRTFSSSQSPTKMASASNTLPPIVSNGHH